VNKKLELDMSEFLIAAEADNVSRMSKILGRLSFDQKERMARGLIKALYPTLYTLPGETFLNLKEEFGFDINEKRGPNDN
jgi:hypothetical protein